MKIASIEKHLKPYNLIRGRKTTINNAFASLIASYDDYDIVKKHLDKDIIQHFEQNSDELHCVYCVDKKADAWDHIYSLVKNGRYSGYGNKLYNLVPCCNSCNGKKGNKNWDEFVTQLHSNDKKTRSKVMRKIKSYVKKCKKDPIIEETDNHKEIRKIQEIILKLMECADILSNNIRGK